MSGAPPRIGFLGPEGTFSHEALRRALRERPAELVGLSSVHDVVMAVDAGELDRGLIPIENSLEGSVNAALDALVNDDADVVIVGEIVHPVRHCLIARAQVALESIEEVVSHPQPLAQCGRFLRERLPGARLLAASSTAEAVRALADDGRGRAALGPRLAAELYGCEVLLAGVEDAPENETRFVWIDRAGGDGAAAAVEGAPEAPWKTSLMFWGVGAEAPGWLVRCLAEFADRDVNLTRIESRPRRQGLGRYMFFLDLEGAAAQAGVSAAVAGLRTHAEHVRVLGSYPAA